MEKASSNMGLRRSSVAFMALMVGGSLIASSAFAAPGDYRKDRDENRGSEVKLHRTPERNPNYVPQQRQTPPPAMTAPAARENPQPQPSYSPRPDNRSERFSQNNRPQPRDNNDGNAWRENRGDNNYRGNDNRGGYNNAPRPQPAPQPQYNNNYRNNNGYRTPQYGNDYRRDNDRNDYYRHDNDKRRFEYSDRSGSRYWGPYGNWTRWNYSWGDPNTYARRWGFDGYDARRGWRRGSTWYAYPSLWSNWGGWYSFFLSGGNWAFSYNDGYSPYGGYGDDCMRVQARDWYRGGRAVVSYVVCENGWGDWREVPGTRQFEYWTY